MYGRRSATYVVLLSTIIFQSFFRCTTDFFPLAWVHGSLLIFLGYLKTCMVKRRIPETWVKQHDVRYGSNAIPLTVLAQENARLTR